MESHDRVLRRCYIIATQPCYLGGARALVKGVGFKNKEKMTVSGEPEKMRILATNLFVEHSNDVPYWWLH